MENLSDSDKIKMILNTAYNKTKNNKKGKKANYIPELAKADETKFGITICMVNGEIFKIGDSNYKVPIESISKLFSYGAALNKFGINTMLKRIGSGGSQLPFNSILGVLFSDSHTISPFINAGAIATTSCHYVPTYNEATAKGPCRYDKNYNAAYRARMKAIIEHYRGAGLKVDKDVFKSEDSTNDLNTAIAYVLKLNKKMYGPVLQCLDAYTWQGSLLVDSTDLAILGAVFANGGVHPLNNSRINTETDVAHLLNSLQAMGLYQYSSIWEIKTGGRVYAKSGVGGGLIIILPNLCSIGIVSPRLDKYGNSVRGIEAGLILSQLLSSQFLNNKIFEGFRYKDEEDKPNLHRQLNRIKGKKRKYTNKSYGPATIGPFKYNKTHKKKLAGIVPILNTAQKKTS
tara:strand:- start:11438 stop:12640 length:1203 start_codon:yes stop_codon:yes gene_type:complete